MISNKDDGCEWYGKLRSRAKGRLKELLEDNPISLMSKSEASELVRELQIYQAELEIQNEELRRAQRELEEARDRFRDLYEFSPVGYLSVSRDGRILEANLTAALLLGVNRSALTAGRLFRWIDERDRGIFRNFRAAAFASDQGEACELRFALGEGKTLDVRLDGVAVRDEKGEPTGLRLAVTDVSLRREIERRWKLADTVLEETGEGVVVFDGRRRIVRVNRAFSRQSGRSREYLKGRDLRELLGNSRDIQVFETARQHLENKERWSGEFTLRRADGSTFPARATLTAVSDGAGGPVSLAAAVIVDVSELKRTEERMRYRAYFDAVTGLPNRILLADRVLEAAKEAERHGARMAFLMVDLDRFKQVNDELGHAAGDELLRATAARLSGCVRDHDTVARLGGDEFAVVLTDVGESQSVATVAEKIVSTLSLPSRIDGAEVQCAASVGIAVYPADTRDHEALQRYADMAMYQAKLEGRGTYRFFDPSLTETARQRLRNRMDLSRALERGEFEVLYQPVIVADTGAVAGAEALLRWRHPERGLLLPEEFLGTAEQTGQIRILGEWVLKEVRREMDSWPSTTDAASPFVSINVSARQCGSPEACEALRTRMVECGFPSGSIAVEIKENVPLENEGAIECIRQLNASGIRVIIDDFGSGYSALGLLRTGPFSAVKIDRSLVAAIESDRAAARLVDTIIYMAHTLGLTAIAAGVETEAQRRFLHEMSCDYIQGRFVGEPKSAQAFRQLLRRPRETT